MPWILDGNNLAGGRDRTAVRSAALAFARRERVKLLLFFDGAPPAGSPSTEALGQVEVRYVPNADAAILGVLRAGGRGWLLATDDRGLAMRAGASGARVVGATTFWSRAGTGPAPRESTSQGGMDLSAEAAYFRDVRNRLPEGGRRVAPGRRRKGHQGRR